MELKKNIFNFSRSGNEYTVKYIFRKTNENLIDIIEKGCPASIIRIGGCEYDCFVNNTLKPVIYEIAGYIDKTYDRNKEIENFSKLREKYIDCMKNSDMIMVTDISTQQNFGFTPKPSNLWSEKEYEFLNNYINDTTPVCHWDFGNFTWEHNTFLNVFPRLNNKKVCIISPFTSDIEEQLKVKDKLFINKCENERVGNLYKNFKYPEFKSVEYIKMPICYAKYENRHDLNTSFNNSLELLEDLYCQISKTSSEIYLISAGIYSNFLCDFVKKHGGIGINCASSLQLFFGLNGNRFHYIEGQGVTNEFWKYPDITKCNILSKMENIKILDTDGLQAYLKKA